jgi:hypothetical protein
MWSTPCLCFVSENQATLPTWKKKRLRSVNSSPTAWFPTQAIALYNWDTEGMLPVVGMETLYGNVHVFLHSSWGNNAQVTTGRGTVLSSGKVIPQSKILWAEAKEVWKVSSESRQGTQVFPASTALLWERVRYEELKTVHFRQWGSYVLRLIHLFSRFYWTLFR